MCVCAPDVSRFKASYCCVEDAVSSSQAKQTVVPVTYEQVPDVRSTDCGVIAVMRLTFRVDMAHPISTLVLRLRLRKSEFEQISMERSFEASG